MHCHSLEVRSPKWVSLETKVLAKPVSSGSSMDNLFPWLFQILELHPWDFLPHCPFLIFEASTLLFLLKKISIIDL